MKTRVSVIIPIYNVQEFLEECIDSVLEQTIIDMKLNEFERNLQVVLVDDGSTDDSAIIAKRYADEYDFVDYVYEENQGLGHARNYGTEFAQGDYIIFLDSDDKVDPRAYERMYKLAIKNDSDMTIGNTWRFNSRGVWISHLHYLSFLGYKEVTHITESPELLYDTGAWNKLFKREFWDKYQFKYPEGLLYEDVAVAASMHYLANNVSIVYENCNLWRVREGISKSITQSATDFKNLTDRLIVLDMIDEFFEKNVTDANLTLAKDMKCIENDLLIFINNIKSLSEKDSKQIMAIICDYINEKINLDNLKYLNEVKRLKYDYLLNGDYDRLINLLNFEDNLRKSKIYSKDSHLVVDCSEDVCDKGYLILDDYLKDYKINSFLKRVSFRKKHLEIVGFACMPGFKVEKFDDCHYSFYLFNERSNKKIPIKYDPVIIKDIDSFNIPFSDSISYGHAGFKIKIPYSEIRDNEDFIGENRILVTFKQKDIERNFFLGIAKKKVKNKSNLKAIMRGENYFCTKYDLYNQLILDIHPVKYRYESIEVVDNKLCIQSPEYNGKIFACYNDSKTDEEYKIPFSYDENNQYYFVEIKDLPYSPGQIKYEDGEVLVHKWKRFMIFSSDEGQCIIKASRDYKYDIEKHESLTEVLDIKENNGIISLNSKFHSIYHDMTKLKSANLIFKDDKTNQIHSIAKGSINDKNEVMFKFNFKDNKITDNLYHGFFDLIVDYKFGEKSFSAPLYLLKRFNYKFSEKNFNYSLYRSGKLTLRINSKLKWSPDEDTYLKREQKAKSKYEFFRKLPINNKRILFESMWGSKYSCNPRYLYEFIDENYPEYECIWSLKDEHTPINGNGKRVRRESLEYFYYLATSKFFVNNVNFATHYEKREGQIEIQTMHGTPLKTLGLDVPGDFKTKQAEETFIKKCSRWDYLTVQNDYVADVTSKCFKFNKKFLNYGYPRTDILFNKNNEKDIAELKSKIGLPLDKKIILYAPTWRQKLNFDLMLDLDSFKKTFSDDYILILRLHHLAFKDWQLPKSDDFVYDLSKYDSIEELYLVSDLLVTDYSSVMFDYANLDKPIILFTYDLKEYDEKIRGFYIDIIENRPGPLVYTSKELEETILNIDKIEEEYKPIRQKFRDKFSQYESGESSEKIFNEVILGNKSKDSKLIKFEKFYQKIFMR